VSDFAFDEDTVISPSGDVMITDRWNGITGIANGGYQMAICLKALTELTPHPDPMVVSGFFLRHGEPMPRRQGTPQDHGGLCQFQYT
jgi:hypothetical protein